jgi:hypothetical protein
MNINWKFFGRWMARKYPGLVQSKDAKRIEQLNQMPKEDRQKALAQDEEAFVKFFSVVFCILVLIAVMLIAKAVLMVVP